VLNSVFGSFIPTIDLITIFTIQSRRIISCFSTGHVRIKLFNQRGEETGSQVAEELFDKLPSF
jgi:hypothetical protein